MKGNIFSLNRWRRHRERKEDETVRFEEAALTELLHHMRQVRETVPVNYDLQESLRKRLLAQAGRPPVTAPAGAGKRLLWGRVSLPATDYRLPSARLLLPVLASLVLLVGVATYWALTGAGNRALEVTGGPREVYRSWSDRMDFGAAFGLEGDKFLVAQDGDLLLLSYDGARHGMIAAAGGHGVLEVAVAPGGGEVALVRGLPEGGVDIALFSAAALRSALQAGGLTVGQLPDAEAILWTAPKTFRADGLVWSPDGEKLAFAVRESDGSVRIGLLDRKGNIRRGGEVYLLTAGFNPAWSPDGKSLVVQRTDFRDENHLWLVPLDDDGELRYLGRGRSPAWSPEGYLVYLTTRVEERVLAYMADGRPQLTVRQPVDEIRWIHLKSRPESAGGAGLMADSRLLLVPGPLTATRFDQELLWRRQLEPSARVVPVVIHLDRELYCYRLIITADGEKLYLFQETGADRVVLDEAGLVTAPTGRTTIILTEVLLGERRESEVEDR